MNFIGQQKVYKFLSKLHERSVEISGLNLLLIGGAGLGKTHIATEFAKQFGSYSYQNVSVNATKRILWNGNMARMKVHIIDEIHVATNFESIYSLLDCKQYFFILCTTDYGSLPESVISRCIRLPLLKYKITEIESIVKEYGKVHGLMLTTETAKIIASRSKDSPRVAKGLVDIILVTMGKETALYTVNDYEAQLNEQGVYKFGYTDLDYLYLRVLKQLGGVSSLSRICALGHFDKKFVMENVEPFLLSQGNIEITSKGRKLIT